MIGRLWRWIASHFWKQTDNIREVLVLSRCPGVTTAPPKNHWAPCHPTTMTRFKASLTCPKGHPISLLNHEVRADGMVYPSVICLADGCSFHRWVRLSNWDFGPL
jgi:hypothetical protein